MNTRRSILWVSSLLLAVSPAASPAPPRFTQEFRYRIPTARRVFLVWGINGLKPAPPHLCPAVFGVVELCESFFAADACRPNYYPRTTRTISTFVKRMHADLSTREPK